jgi:hypothetical protein
MSKKYMGIVKSMQAKDLILERKKKMMMMIRFNFFSLYIDIFSKSFISEALANENKMTKFCT